MAKWDNINGIIENAIKSNNAQNITGDSLQSVLKSIVSDVGANATFAGIAIASTSPGSYDGPVFYIAASAGTYAGFGSIVVNAGELAVLYNSANSNGWSKSSIGLSSIVDKSITKAKLASDVPIDAMQNKITQLETSVNTVVGEGATEAIENFAEILAFLNGITDTTTLEGLLTNLKTEIDGKLSNKVDKVSGKGLSTNDYTTAEKDKLAGIEAGANNYSHPAYTARTGVPTADAKPGFGGTFQVSQPVSDGHGHITAVNARTITIPNAAATTSAPGLMSSTDKSKLDGIESGAQKNTVTGIKGNAETSYRTGNVNLTPANVGAAAASHSHAISDVNNLQTTLDGKAAKSHTHSASEITSGTLPADRIADGSITGEKLAKDISIPFSLSAGYILAGVFATTATIDEPAVTPYGIAYLIICKRPYLAVDSAVNASVALTIGSNTFIVKTYGLGKAASMNVGVVLRAANSTEFTLISGVSS